MTRVDKNKIYNEDSIQSLGVLGGIRARPASIGIENQNHTYIEIIANAIDEAREGFGDLIIVTKHIDGSVSIQDFGRSVPMDKNSKGEYSYKKVFDEIYSGGKYENNNDSGNYQKSLGTNGAGALASNYTSDFFHVTAVSPNGYKYHVEYKEGIQQTELIKEKHELDYTGTLIRWKPSEDVFRGKGEVDDWFIESTLKNQSIVNKGLRFEFINEKTNENKEYYYENGIVDYIKDIGQDKNYTNIIQWETEAKGRENDKDKEEYKIGIELTFAFNNEYPFIQHFHNSSWLENGGTPDEYIKAAFTYSIDKLIKSKGLYQKNEKKITYDDIRDTLILVTNSFSTISLFTDQAKKKLHSDFMKRHAIDWIRQQLEVYFMENTKEANEIVEKVLINKRSREKSEKTRLDIKKKLQSESKSGLAPKIEGLNDCDMDDSELYEREAWVCEGDSACQTMTNSRDQRIMGTIPLGGRFISSLKNSVEDVLNNKVALSIIQALGCGIEIPKEERSKYKHIKTFDNDASRYWKIIIATDSDAWGHSIALALATFFYKYMPTLLKQNRIYISLSPRYKFTVGKEEIFAYNDKERDEIQANLEGENKKYHLGIIKGLGELNRDTYWNYVMNPETRRIEQLIYNEDMAEQIDHYFNVLMGEMIDERKQFIRENILNLDLSTID